ncbi:MAG: hypothetical protein KH138_12470, partial [Firmicutes bacterium]|nr:hypothetical protein [Bacillota bacterium]
GGLFVLLFRCLPFANFSWVSSCLGLDFLFAGFLWIALRIPYSRVVRQKNKERGLGFYVPGPY